jgi:N-acetylneuraminic acid mutarotase
MAPFPGELRMFGSGAATSTKGYITCGLGGAINPLNDLWEYDEAANTWSARADLPGPARSDATAFVMNNKLFLFGGNDGSMALNDLWEYDPDANSWTQKSSLPDAGRKNAMIFTIGDTAYVVGGWPDNNISSAQVWEYIGSNDTWNRLDDFPGTATAGGGAFTIRNRGYIVTGYNSKECWEYVPAATSVGVSMPLMQDFSVFPNPFNDHFTIQLNRHTDDMLAVSITDIMGKQICSSVNYQAYGDKISIVDLGGIPAGVYFVTLTDKNGQVRKSKVLHN